MHEQIICSGKKSTKKMEQKLKKNGGKTFCIFCRKLEAWDKPETEGEVS